MTTTDVTPMHPRDFQRMTDRQRRGLAALRRRQVEQARAEHVVARRDSGLVTAFLAALAPLFEEVRDAQTCTCGRPAHARGLCWLHYDRWRAAMRAIREVAA